MLQAHATGHVCISEANMRYFKSFLAAGLLAFASPAAAQQLSQRIDDVHAFDGHIACDPVSASELVVPLIHAGKVIGVLDIDSPHKAHFSVQDQACAEALVELYIASMIRYPAQPPAW